MAALPLTEQIRRALTEPAKAADVASLLGEVKVAESAAQKALEAAQAKALDPSLADDAANVAQQDRVQREFARDRLGAAAISLAKREAELRTAEAEAEHDRALEAATAARDALAIELAEKWPKLSGEMADLIRRLQENDALIAPFHLVSAEAVARQCPGNFYMGLTPVNRFTRAQIPGLSPTASAWPDPRLRLVG